MRKLLPIGSVVLLRGMNNRTLIIGRFHVDKATGVKYHYAGCSYPLGMVNSQNVRLFNADDICELFCIGFQDRDEYMLREELSKQMEN